MLKFSELDLAIMKGWTNRQLDRPAFMRGLVVFVQAIKGDVRVCPHITTHPERDRPEPTI